MRIISIDLLERCWIEGEGRWVPLAGSETRQFHLVGVAAGEEIDLDEAVWSVAWGTADAESKYSLTPDGTMSMKSSGANATGTLTARIGTQTVKLPLVTCAYGTSLSSSYTPLSYILYAVRACRSPVCSLFAHPMGRSSRKAASRPSSCVV